MEEAAEHGEAGKVQHLSNDEERVIAELVREAHGGEGGFSWAKDGVKLVDRLQRQLTALEEANVHEILESRLPMGVVQERLDQGTQGLEAMHVWLETNNLRLAVMRDDIEAIEAKNNALEAEQRNQRALLAAIRALVKATRVDRATVQALCESDLGSRTGARRAAEGAAALEGVLDVLREGPEGGEALLVPEAVEAWRSMRLVVARKGEAAQLVSRFCGRVAGALASPLGKFAAALQGKGFKQRAMDAFREEHAELLAALAGLGAGSAPREPLLLLAREWGPALAAFLEQQVGEVSGSLRRAHAEAMDRQFVVCKNPGTAAVDGAHDPALCAALAAAVRALVGSLAACHAALAPWLESTFLTPSQRPRRADEEQDAEALLAEALLCLCSPAEAVLTQFVTVFVVTHDPWALLLSAGAAVEACATSASAKHASHLANLGDRVRQTCIDKFGQVLDSYGVFLAQGARSIPAKSVGLLPAFLGPLGTALQKAEAGVDLEVIAHAQRKVIDAFMSPVEACASGDAKYADLVRLTHLHYLVAVAEGEGCGASTPVLVAKVLPPFRRQVKMVTESYCAGLISRSFGDLLAMHKLLRAAAARQSRGRGGEPGEGLGLADYKRVRKSCLDTGALTPKIGDLRKRLEKHLSAPPGASGDMESFLAGVLLPLCWAECRTALSGTWADFGRRAAEMWGSHEADHPPVQDLLRAMDAQRAPADARNSEM